MTVDMNMDMNADMTVDIVCAKDGGNKRSGQRDAKSDLIYTLFATATFSNNSA